MRIACIGNMNNNFFSLVRYLRDVDIDAHLLLLNNELGHFHPASDSYDLSYQQFTHTVGWGNILQYRSTSAQKIVNDLAGYDYVISCGSAPAFLQKAGIISDLIIPYGTDLYEYPFFKFINPRYQLDYIAFYRSQRKALQRCSSLSWDASNATVDKILKKIGYKGKRICLGIPMVYTTIYHPQRIKNYYDRSQWYQEFKKIREQNQLMVFHQTRHYWQGTHDSLDHKANDILINGFANFCQANPDITACLILLEYGKQVEHSKSLIKDLQIVDKVYWFPIMPRKDLMIGLSLADIGTGEFGRSWLSCGSIYETLSMAKPLLHYRKDELYLEDYPELYPMINCPDPQSVTAALTDYIANPDKYKEIGKAGLAWFKQYAVDKPLTEYKRLIQEAK